jgi:hypothetical protein
LSAYRRKRGIPFNSTVTKLESLLCGNPRTKTSASESPPVEIEAHHCEVDCDSENRNVIDDQ